MGNVTEPTTDLNEWLSMLESDRAELLAQRESARIEQEAEQRAQRAKQGEALRSLLRLLGFDPGELPEGHWQTPDGITVTRSNQRGVVVINFLDSDDPYDSVTFDHHIYTNDIEVNPARVRQELALAIHNVRERWLDYVARQHEKQIERTAPKELPPINRAYRIVANQLEGIVNRVRNGTELSYGDISILAHAQLIDHVTYNDHDYDED
jgi:glutathione S-transferase